MKPTLSALALSTLALCGAAHAQTTRAALVQDVERPSAANIVNVHCLVSSSIACPLYAVPAGKILHVTEVSYVLGGNPYYFQIGTDNYTSVWYPVTSGTNFVNSEVNLYLPAGSQVIARTPTAAYMDVTVYGVLADQ